MFGIIRIKSVFNVELGGDEWLKSSCDVTSLTANIEALKGTITNEITKTHLQLLRNEARVHPLTILLPGSRCSKLNSRFNFLVYYFSFLVMVLLFKYSIELKVNSGLKVWQKYIV